MNYNPLLVKNFLIGQIPFIKERTESLYGKYLSDNKFLEIIPESETPEILSAYSMFNNYITNFVFDEGDISSNSEFSEKEWDMLGIFLRGLAEVENVNLMHLYNCFYNYSGLKVKGKVVTGRIYTLYSSSRLTLNLSVADFYGRPLRITILDGDIPSTEIEDSDQNYIGVKLNSISKNSPVHFIVEPGENPKGVLVKITMEFEQIVNTLSGLFEGSYPGLNDLSVLLNPKKETRLIPSNLKIGEYARKLVEFFAGTLITPLSNSKLRENLSRELPGSSYKFEERVIENTPGIYNKDGYMDRRIDL